MEDRVCLQICTFNRGHLLKNTLEKLTFLTKPFEILIIDDGSSDNTKEIVDLYKDKLPIKYIFNYSPNWEIASYARNIGIKNTDCEIIITIEPELLPLMDFIPLMLNLHKEIPNQVISAGTIYHAGHLNIFSQELIDAPYNILNNKALVNENRLNPNPINSYGFCKVVGWVASFAALYRKEWLMSIGAWDEGFATYSWEDTDCLTRLTKIGINQYIANEIEFIHQYHQKLNSNVSKQVNEQNEARFKNKNFNLDDINNDVIANKGKEWGVIKTR